MRLKFTFLKKAFLFVLFCCANENVKAQSAADSSKKANNIPLALKSEYIPVVAKNSEIQSANDDGKDVIFTVAEVVPEYKGGRSAMYQYISNNIRYPDTAQEYGVEGRVIVNFVIDKEGNVKDVKAKTHLGYGLEEEAIRVIARMPKWKPGKNNGREVNTYFTLPIKFVLETEQEKVDTKELAPKEK